MPSRPAPHPHRKTRGSRSLVWRLLAPAVFVLAGALFITSMVSAQGTDLRAGRYDDLQGLANADAKDLSGLQGRVGNLNEQVDRLSKNLNSTGVGTEQRRAMTLKGPVGLVPVHGPGVTITLDDAPDDVLAAAGSDVSDLLVHQQDIQAVANALWAGGAEAMTIQGQRVVNTTGIKCVGNTVILHGVPYSPPYHLSAIGPRRLMLDAVSASPYIKLYLELVPQGLGWDVKQEDTLDLPGYQGSTQLDYAQPVSGRRR